VGSRSTQAKGGTRGEKKCGKFPSYFRCSYRSPSRGKRKRKKRETRLPDRSPEGKTQTRGRKKKVFGFLHAIAKHQAQLVENERGRKKRPKTRVIARKRERIRKRQRGRKERGVITDVFLYLAPPTGKEGEKKKEVMADLAMKE